MKQITEKDILELLKKEKVKLKWNNQTFTIDSFLRLDPFLVLDHDIERDDKPIEFNYVYTLFTVTVATTNQKYVAYYRHLKEYDFLNEYKATSLDNNYLKNAVKKWGHKVLILDVINTLDDDKQLAQSMKEEWIEQHEHGINSLEVLNMCYGNKEKYGINDQHLPKVSTAKYRFTEFKDVIGFGTEYSDCICPVCGDNAFNNYHNHYSNCAEEEIAPEHAEEIRRRMNDDSKPLSYEEVFDDETTVDEDEVNDDIDDYHNRHPMTSPENDTEYDAWLMEQSEIGGHIPDYTPDDDFTGINKRFGI